jgi:hypothetical protein
MAPVSPPAPRKIILSGHADIRDHHRRQVDLVEIEARVASDNAGRHGLASARRTGEQSLHGFEPDMSVARPLAAELHFTISVVTAFQLPFPG